MKRSIGLILVLCMITVIVSGCGVKKNTVFGVDDLPGKKIGVQLGTTGDIYASDYEKKGSTIERYNKGADAVQALKQGKIDCVIIDNEPARVFVEKNEDLKILDEPFEVEDYAICIDKGNTELKDKINAALAKLKSDGILENIINNYIGDDTKGKTPYVSPSNVSRSNGVLKMATNAEFEPYEYMEGDKVVGIDADMAQAVADILGMELKIENMEFDSIITSVQSGKADIGVAGMTVTEDRKKNVDFTDSYTTATQVIIVRVK
ncbi:MAG: transporter substrate-binding domain-containing protein [Oscillospiraceae bacterium]|nr:transporter substrate-binding domain-containing protein [Oscillospiraceae bacterium]MDD4413737.1 transporter substrate-binding domain-containing protein [Oscillospiraceae bacterium]